MLKFVSLKIISAILFVLVFCILIESADADDNCRLSTLEEDTAFPKYYWALVIDYPPDSQYTIEADEVPNTNTDCWTIEGAEMYFNITDRCPGSRTLGVYLLMSRENLLSKRRTLGGCKGVLESSNLGYSDITDIFQKIYYQVNILETYWRTVDEISGFFKCKLKNGKMAYPIDYYSIPVDYPEAALSWSTIPLNSPEVIEIIENLYYKDKLIIHIYKANNFSGTEYGEIYSNHNFTLATTGPLIYYWEMYYQDETTACYCFDSCSGVYPAEGCFDVVGIVEDFKLEDRQVIFKSSDLGLLVPWPY